jgi:hypothetical protein
MLFFLIVPIWLLFVLTGVVLLLLRQHRRMGWYSIIVSTTAALTSYFLSTAVLYLGARFRPHPNIKWLGIAVVGAYVLAIAIGIALGGTAGFFLTRKLMAFGHAPRANS